MFKNRKPDPDRRGASVTQWITQKMEFPPEAMEELVKIRKALEQIARALLAREGQG